MDNRYIVNGKYYPTIGVECHVQLKTKTKLFAGVGNDARDAEPNTLISPICVGLPGVLPVLNGKVIDLSVKAGLALRAHIAEVSHFDRKHYFYPDLPKGYQITQLQRPIITDGIVEAPMLDGSYVTVRVERAHIEEDAGKSTHPAGKDYSLVDLNRAGTPLLEIVSSPDMHSPAEARAYAHELYLLMKYADVSDVDLYHGNMRFDVNVSVSSDPEVLGTRTETKNLNSFKSIEKAVEFEINRQIKLLEKGETIVQETRGWDDNKQITISQRSKEDAHDYRYFPDPDIPPVIVEPSFVAEVANNMPKLPMALREAFGELGFDDAQIATLLEEPVVAAIVEYVLESHGNKAAKTVANWCMGELSKLYIDGRIKWSEVQNNIAGLIKVVSMLDENKLSSTAAKDLLYDIVSKNSDPEKLAKDRNLLQVSDDGELDKIVETVLQDNAQAANDVRSGEMKAIGFLVGQVMKASQGRANPAKVQEIIKRQLGV